jgi:hypothetical protein
VIFLLVAREDVHGVVANRPLQLEGLGRVGVAPAKASTPNLVALVLRRRSFIGLRRRRGRYGQVGDAEASAGSEGAASLVLAAMSSALVRATTSASLSSRSAKAASRGYGSCPCRRTSRSAITRAASASAIHQLVGSSPPAFDRLGYHGCQAKRLPLGLPDHQPPTGDDEIGKLTLGFEANSPGGKRNGHPISPSSISLTDSQKP